ncbi:MAG: DUF4293 domain-containing protein [Dysgonamonadaceae bacterium]|jgi:hypothetical protein|nr:DUF4293 domain-containing protein [Dysgonamonadaceae bacterium]
MIQRVQSVYLFIVFLLAAVMFFLPATETGVEIRWFFCGFTGIAALGIIFLYKKRKFQMAASLLLGLLFLLFFAIHFPILQFEFSVSCFFLFIPLIAAGFAFAACHAVKKDEKLVRSLDRLR